MFTKLTKLSEEEYEKAKDFFSEIYQETLIQKPNLKQSLIARYAVSNLVLENFQVQNFFPRTDTEGKPMPKNGIHWSISHSGDMVFTGVSKHPIGVDIEICKDRDFSILNQGDTKFYEQFGKNWESFYMQWSSKESIIKALGMTLDSMNNITFNSSEIEKYDSVGNADLRSLHVLPENFNNKKNKNHILLFDLGGKTYRVVNAIFREKKGTYTTSVCKL